MRELTCEIVKSFLRHVRAGEPLREQSHLMPHGQQSRTEDTHTGLERWRQSRVIHNQADHVTGQRKPLDCHFVCSQLPMLGRCGGQARSAALGPPA
jgi:hypothetical protein